ncbi:MAG: Ig-like domain-containing protein [Candidatus Thermoplasmatota archaeon]|jgi:hypothetical protein|nr:Ig-like domain-containing protein [Candidatus Thermoplasmatota archaeon]
MGKNTTINMRLGYIINKHTPAKFISILMVFLMVSTVFSSTVFAEKPVDKIKEKVTEIIGKISDKAKELVQEITDRGSDNPLMGSVFREMSLFKRESILSLVTNYNGTVKSTRFRLFLPTVLDVDGDGKKDVRVWVFRRPGVDFSPPAVCLKTTLVVRRLNDDIKSGPFEIYLDYTPKIVSKLLKTSLPNFRIGYQTPDGKEVPKTCIVTHKSIPHLIYPRLQTTHRVGINPVSIVGKSDSQLNLLFSIVNETDESKLTIQVNHSPAVKNEISFSLKKEHFVRLRGRTIDIIRQNVVDSNVTLLIKDIIGNDEGSLSIKNIPKQISLSWLLGIRNGYIDINTYGYGTGNVEATVNNALKVGFIPETGLDFHLGWRTPGIRKIKKGVDSDITFNTYGSAVLSNLYMFVPDSINLTASLLSLKLGVKSEVGGFVLKPFGADNLLVNVTNAEVTLKDCNVDFKIPETPDKPKVSIVNPKDGDEVEKTIIISGITVPADKKIKMVQIWIDDGEKINLSVDADGNWSYGWNTLGLVPNGEHTISAISIDEGGKVSDEDKVTITVNNEGGNWYPTVDIKSPYNLQLVSGVVYVNGTASDKNNDPLKVYLDIKNILDKSVIGGEIELAVDKSGRWSYKWDTSKLTAGLHTISVKSYDGKDYTVNPVSIYVWVKIKSALDFTLADASINVTNFALKLDITGKDISQVEVSSLKASGNGYLSTGETFSVGGLGVLDVKDAYISLINKTGVTTKPLDNLSVYFDGQGSLELSKEEISLGFDASIYLHVDEAFGIENSTLGLKGRASAKIKFDKSGCTIGDEDNFDVNITDLVFKVDKKIDISAKRISANGTGDISITGKKITLSSSSIKSDVDELSVYTDLGVFSVSGKLNQNKYGEITFEFIDLFNFKMSYNGYADMVITDFKFKVNSSKGNATVSAKSVNVEPEGHAEFSYYKDELDIISCIDVIGITLDDLLLGFNDSFYGPFDLRWDGSACFTLTSDVLIEHGSDWIRITIGGKGRASFNLHTTIKINEYKGYLNADMSLTNGNEKFVVYLYNLKSNNKGFNIYGSAVLNLELFELYLENSTTNETLVNISIVNLKASFDMNSSGGKNGDEGRILFNLKEAGVALENGHIFINIAGQYCFSLAGLVSISTSVGTSGAIEVIWNESGLKIFEVDFDSYTNVSIENLRFRYIKYIKGSSAEPSEVKTDIKLSAEKILINKNSKFVITSDYINIKINPSDYNTLPTKENPDTKEFTGVLLEDFYLNATLSNYTGAEIDIGSLKITSSIDIYYDGNISIKGSGHITGDDIFICAGVKYDVNFLFISVDIDSLDVYAQGTAEVTVKDKNISLYGYGDHTDISLVNADVNLIFSELYMFLTLKELNIQYTGSAEINVKLDNSGLVAKATLFDDNAYITIKTLWAYISFVGAEIRLDDVLIYGDTTITLDLTSEVFVTIHTDETITIRAVLISLYFIDGPLNIRLYGVSNNAVAGGSSFSIGVDALSNLLIGINGSWHINGLCINKIGPVKNIDVAGEISPLIIGFEPSFTFIRFEGTVIRPTSLYLELTTFGGISFDLNPGIFSVAFDLGESFGILAYSESYLTVNLIHPLLTCVPIKLKGLVEIYGFTVSISENEDEVDEILSIVYLKLNGELEIANRWNINGSCTVSSLSIEYTGNYFTDMLLRSNIDCYGTLYITRWNHWRIAIDGELHLSPRSFIFDDSSNEVIIESSEALVTINQITQQININTINGENIEIYANGQIVINGNQVPAMGATQNQEVQQQAQQQVQQILENILPGILWIWIWRPFQQDWMRVWPINPQNDPPLIKGVVTLLTRHDLDNALDNIKIIPGDKVNFTAWLLPGQEKNESSDHYTFSFDFGEGNTSVVNISKSVKLIRVHPSLEPKYLVPGTYTATVTVTDGSLEIASPTTIINVVEEYLDVEETLNEFDYEKIRNQTVVHGYFTVKNIANESCSNYMLHWNMSIPEIPFGSNWNFEPKEGILGPNKSQIVNFSFTLTSQDTPGDYDTPGIIFYDRNNTDVKDVVKIHIYYGLVELFPVYDTVYFIKKDSNTTLDDVFWVISNRFETLDWEIKSVSITEGNQSDFEYGFKPSSGTLPPNNSFAGVDLWINANEQFTGCTMKVKVQRKNDVYDYDNVTIIIKAVKPDKLQNYISPDSHDESDWIREDYAYDEMPILTWAVYKELGVNGWSDPLTLKKNAPINIDGFKIRARKETHLDQMEIKFYNGANQVGSTLTYTDWLNRDWKDVELNSPLLVDKVVIRFHEDAPLTGFWVHRAFVYEFYFIQEP